MIFTCLVQNTIKDDGAEGAWLLSGSCSTVPMQCEEVYKVETTYGRVFGALAHIAGLAHGGCLLYHPTLCTQAGLFSGGGVRWASIASGKLQEGKRSHTPAFHFPNGRESWQYGCEALCVLKVTPFFSDHRGELFAGLTGYSRENLKGFQHCLKPI